MNSPGAVVVLDGTDPWRNLAVEEALWQDSPPETFRLVLYRNAPCVVLGRHQNPLREVRLDELGRRGVPLVRRVTGGGTVWHDEGNLNFSFLWSQSSYDRIELQKFVSDSLNELGSKTLIGEKGDLMVEGSENRFFKVSGNAFAFRGGRVLHHGTLLCDARLDDLRGVLGPTGELTTWVGTPSRPAPVANVGMDPLEVVQGLSKAFLSRFDAEVVDDPFAASGGDRRAWEQRVAEVYARLVSAEWTWDATPPFSWRGITRSGRREVRVEEGRVVAGEFEAEENLLFFSSRFFEYLPKRA